MSLSDYIMDYLKMTFNLDLYNSFIMNTLNNFISYAVDNFNYGKDQLAYYLIDMIDEVDFKEISKVLSNYEKEYSEQEGRNYETNF